MPSIPDMIRSGKDSPYLLRDTAKAFGGGVGAEGHLLAAADRIENLESMLISIRDYPGKDDSSDAEGYPLEIAYDEFAYKRMVDTYREAAGFMLRESD